MKRSIKYFTVAFLLLMGYSQIFTYVYLGVISTTTTRNTDGDVHFQSTVINTNFFENAIIEENEENKDERELLNNHTRDYTSFTAFVCPVSFLQPSTARSNQFSPFQYNTLSGDSWIRFCVVRV